MGEFDPAMGIWQNVVFQLLSSGSDINAALAGADLARERFRAAFPAVTSCSS